MAEPTEWDRVKGKRTQPVNNRAVRETLHTAAEMIGDSVTDERLDAVLRVMPVFLDMLRALREVPAEERGTVLGSAFALSAVAHPGELVGTVQAKTAGGTDDR